MIQKIVETIQTTSGAVHTLENGTLIKGFEIDMLDQETLGLPAVENIIRSFTNDLSENETIRFVLKSKYTQDSNGEHSRSQAVQEIGHVKNSAFVFLEKRAPLVSFLGFSNRKTLGAIQLDLSSFTDRSLMVRELSSSEISENFPRFPSELNHNFQTIDFGSEVISILRLVRQSEFGMDMETLSRIKDSLPLPYTLVCSVEIVSQAIAETMLRRRTKQNSDSSDLKENRKLSEAQTDLEDVSLNGGRLFRFEWLAILNRTNEESLRNDREEARRKLSELGEIYVESVGALRSLKASSPGEGAHFAVLEKDSTLPCYIPLVTQGSPLKDRQSRPRSLAVHRRDESITFVDVFDPSYDSFSWCIFGRPGTGKSVLVNAFTRALANDRNIKLIKIDVGGSHSRETKLLGGIEKTLNLNEPTGLNPFNVISELGNTKEAIQILSNFLEVLILEDNESKLSKTLKSDLEQSLQVFSEKDLENLDLESFFKRGENIPRKDLLKRWVGKGVYGNAFVTTNFRNPISNNLTYYNFSKISQALDPDYAQGGLAAVMAQFNIEMLKKAKDKKRIVFIADETPFFIKKCFSFFNLSIANVRKEGHGFITVAQKSSHVVIDQDTGILDNSPNKIFFSLDGDDDSFAARTQLSKDAVQKIKTLERVQGEFSEAFLKDGKGERVLRIRLSPEEYWAYTSKDEDKRKIDELKAACPSLSLGEVIKCLSLS